MAIYTSLWEKLHMLMVKPWNARELEELTSKCRGVKTGKDGIRKHSSVKSSPSKDVDH